MERRHKIALLLCAVLCASILFSHAFIAAQTHHDCSGEHCGICFELKICTNLLNFYSILAHLCRLICVCICMGGCIYSAAVHIAHIDTPVSLKVKLTN